MNQVYAVCAALKVLMEEDRYVNDNKAEWERVWNMKESEFPVHEFVPKTE